MQQKVILVPKDKFPLDVLAEMGKETKKAWIFLHQKVVDNLFATANRITQTFSTNVFIWVTSQSDVVLRFVQGFDTNWYSVSEIQSENIAFKKRPSVPDEILFLKMEE